MASNAMMTMNPIAAVRQTVQVMDQHGKVIHDTSKTFFSAFREAKEAYRQRKAEIAAERIIERRTRDRLRRSQTVPHTSGRAIENGSVNGGNMEIALQRRRHKSHPSRRGSSNGSVSEDEFEPHALVRRGSNDTLATEDGTIYSPGGAGGEIMTDQIRAMGAPLFNDPSVKAISDMLAHVQALIDELSCWTAGLSTLISELQKTPDTLAAVGLALAEISTMVAKISPIALPILKSSFPTVFALLSSPHFTIVAGIGAAATVVVLGGYRIVQSVMAGAQENLKLANEDDSGLIIGEVFEDNLIEPAPSRRQEEPVEDVIMPPRRGVSRAITAPPAMEERMILGFDLGRDEKKAKKKEKEEKKIKEDRKREKEEKRLKEEKREKEEKRAKEERKREKEEKEERKREKEARRERKERRAGSVVGSSSGKSESGEEKKPKKGLKALFDGRSA